VDDETNTFVDARRTGQVLGIRAKRGLLRARYGRGTYIYTGYAFFRQLPNGVPGAIRLYVNLLSAGHGKP
jgi:hypothetical protein